MLFSLKSARSSSRLLHLFGLGQFCSPKFVEVVAIHGGFDAVWFDQEHVGLTTPQIEEVARAARGAGLDSFVRLPVTDYACVMRCLEAGAGGIMAAMIRNGDEVRRIVQWAKFFPDGQRGVNGGGVDGRYGTLAMRDYFRIANETTVVGIQIEHIEAVQNIADIAAVPGVDFLFIGPADLSQTMGIPGEWNHPKLWEAFQHVADACAKTGLPWAILPLGPEFASRCVDMGCKMLCTGFDMWAISRGIKAIKAEYGGLFKEN
jgi:2-dehydro-3-deoxyglucarate aldolase/4-hydroxy-2-oxoheptanedioate aldolase